jgi:hypothetical protein
MGELGLDADGLLLVPAKPVLALGGHVELGRSDGPSFRAAVRRSLSTTISTLSVGGRLDWTWGRFDGCPLRASWSHINLRPCAFAEFGEIDAEGFGGAQSTRRGRPWVAVGALGRLDFHARAFVGSLDVGLGVPINRESFVFTPSPVVYEIPPLVPYLGLSLGAGAPL